MYRQVLAAIVIAVLPGCSDAPLTLDTSSDEAFKASMLEMQNSLDDTKREQFTEAVTAVAFSNLDMAALMGGADPEAQANEAMQKLSGMTADEVIDLAALLAAERDEKRSAAAEKKAAEAAAKIAELTEQLDSIPENVTIEITEPSFLWEDNPVLQIYKFRFTAKNTGSIPVARLEGRLVVSSPGRSIPWADGGFKVAFPGGIEPSEATTGSITLNNFGDDWSGVPRNETLALDVSLTRAVGPGDKVIFDLDARADLEEEIARLR